MRMDEATLGGMTTSPTSTVAVRQVVDGCVQFWVDRPNEGLTPHPFQSQVLVAPQGTRSRPSQPRRNKRTWLVGRGSSTSALRQKRSLGANRDEDERDGPCLSRRASWKCGTTEYVRVTSTTRRRVTTATCQCAGLVRSR